MAKLLRERGRELAVTSTREMGRLPQNERLAASAVSASSRKTRKGVAASPHLW